MNSDIEQEYGWILSQHGQWFVTEKGLVARTPGIDEYFISRDEIAALFPGTRKSLWVEHMAGKSWVVLPDLIDAIKAGIRIYGASSHIDWSN